MATVPFSPAQASTHPTKQKGLLGLPRELRDNVHDFVLEDMCFPCKLQTKLPAVPKDAIIEGSPHTAASGEVGGSQAVGTGEDEAIALTKRPLGLTAFVRSKAPASILRVCRQFQEECGKRAAHSMTLILEDSDSFNFESILLPEQVISVRWLELYIVLFCHSCPVMTHMTPGHCRAVSEISKHKVWIEDVLRQLPQLRSISIWVYLAHDGFEPGTKTRMPCEGMVQSKIQELQSLPHLKEMAMYRYRYDEKKDFKGPKDLILEWRPEARKGRVPRSTLSC